MSHHGSTAQSYEYHQHLDFVCIDRSIYLQIALRSSIVNKKTQLTQKERATAVHV